MPVVEDGHRAAIVAAGLRAAEAVVELRTAAEALAAEAVELRMVAADSAVVAEPRMEEAAVAVADRTTESHELNLS